MKLFGGKSNKTRTAPRRDAPKRARRTGGKTGWHSLSGTARGLILLALSALALAGVIYGVSKALIKPPVLPEAPVIRREPEPEPADGDPAAKPVKTENRPAPIRYADDDGNEVEFQFERPGSVQEGYYNILIVGTDNDGTRTDTIMIARLDANEHTVAMMSVPRDTLINGNYSVPKINSVYGGNGKGEKGIKALEEQLQSILGFEVNGYVMVDLEAFIEVVDLVGGVTFNVPQRMYYSDPTQNLYIDLQAGEQLLDGQHAMQLVRYRKYGEADIQRTRVQQDFLKALAKKCLSFGNITKIKPMIEIGIEYVDTDLTLGNMLYFAQELMKCDLDEMVSFTLPGQGGVRVGGGSGDYYALFASQVQEIVNENFNPYDTDIPLSSFHIRGGVRSSAPVKPNVSAKPAPAPVVEPAEPEDPPLDVDGPDSPDEPTGPDDPDNPNNPDDPNNPGDPDGTGDPNSPDDPNNPSNPDETNNPGDPNGTGDPNSPDSPNNPDDPNNPSNPDETNNPGDPNSPSGPDNPDETGQGSGGTGTPADPAVTDPSQTAEPSPAPPDTAELPPASDVPQGTDALTPEPS